MGRKSHARTLCVWMNGQHVGDWTIAPNGPTGGTFAYSQAWRVSAARRPLSLSLPIPLNDIPLKGPEVGHFFDNLLPDSEAIRRRIQTRFKTESQDPFDLLAEIGRDCVGAVQLLSPDVAPHDVHRIDCEALTDAQVEAWLSHVVSPASAMARMDDADVDDFRISIAGAQEKTALLWHAGRWNKPHRSTPSTHIFKLPLGLIGNRKADMSTSVENEWLCAQIMRAFGMPTASCEITRFGKQKALVVERFDRRMAANGRSWLRLPQEDFCQALGMPPTARYEADGGPGIPEMAKLLALSDQAEIDLSAFFKTQFLFFLMAATDGHAKNFSIHLLPGDRYRLTPLYDVLSAWPIIGNGPNQIALHKAKLAMSLRGKSKHYKLVDIQPRHFIETARRCGYTSMSDDMAMILDELEAKLDQVGAELPKDFPEKVFEAIRKGMRSMKARCPISE